MATVSRTGITPRTLQSYRALFESRFREALGQDLNVDPETTMGGIISVMALSATENDETLVRLSNSLAIDTAIGKELDDLISPLGVFRTPATRSTGTLTLGGTPNAAIPEGIIVTNGEDEYQTTAAATLDDNGVGSVEIESVELGPIPGAAGTIVHVERLVEGLTSVTNAAAVEAGDKIESDNALRLRYRRTLATYGRGTIDAIIAAVSNSGADIVSVRENNTGSSVTVQGLSISAHSIHVITLGGDDDDIADAIAASKPLGIGTDGSTTVGSINFTKISEVQIKVVITTTATPDFPSDGLTQMRARMLIYMSQQSAGSSVDSLRLQAAAAAVPGHVMSAFTVTDTDDVALPATPNLNVIYRLITENISIAVSEG